MSSGADLHVRNICMTGHRVVPARRCDEPSHAAKRFVPRPGGANRGRRNRLHAGRRTFSFVLVRSGAHVLPACVCMWSTRSKREYMRLQVVLKPPTLTHYIRFRHAVVIYSCMLSGAIDVDRWVGWLVGWFVGLLGSFATGPRRRRQHEFCAGGRASGISEFWWWRQRRRCRRRHRGHRTRWQTHANYRSRHVGRGCRRVR